jgi:hypothetical protein
VNSRGWIPYPDVFITVQKYKPSARTLNFIMRIRRWRKQKVMVQ